MLSDGRLEQILNRIPHLTVGVLGDLFLDRYLDIDARLTEPSIETGLDAYQVTRVRASPGAAGTVINNLVALGVRQVYPVAVIGDDGEGYELRQALADLRVVALEAVFAWSGRRTPTYTKPMLHSEEGTAARTQPPGHQEPHAPAPCGRGQNPHGPGGYRTAHRCPAGARPGQRRRMRGRHQPSPAAVGRDGPEPARTPHPGRQPGTHRPVPLRLAETQSRGMPSGHGQGRRRSVPGRLRCRHGCAALAGPSSAPWASRASSWPIHALPRSEPSRCRPIPFTVPSTSSAAGDSTSAALACAIAAGANSKRRQPSATWSRPSPSSRSAPRARPRLSRSVNAGANRIMNTSCLPG